MTKHRKPACRDPPEPPSVDYNRQRHGHRCGLPRPFAAYVQRVADYGELVTAHVATALAARRHELGWSLAEAAVRADLHRSTVHLIEQGRRGMTLGAAARLARALDVPLAELVAEAERLAK